MVAEEIDVQTVRPALDINTIEEEFFNINPGPKSVTNVSSKLPSENIVDPHNQILL